jgi:hypothetical protein
MTVLNVQQGGAGAVGSSQNDLMFILWRFQDVRETAESGSESPLEARRRGFWELGATPACTSTKRFLYVRWKLTDPLMSRPFVLQTCKVPETQQGAKSKGSRNACTSGESGLYKRKGWDEWRVEAVGRDGTLSLCGRYFRFTS